MAYPGYQCVKFTDSDGNITEYCSSTKVKSHAVGRNWVADLMSTFDLQANAMNGKPYIKNNQPSDATIHPE